ncbi:recombinase family protein [Bacillus altitudinis]|uniref:recombinase family protein n=1 Tax=Bacillus altitudinis TaxID=293387 RepID=UPI0010FF7847|nr:recombinase family protein [Bacillus altitudinis]QCU21012.1 recombinase family protein [Bacillus altitudinis]
MKKKVAVAYLRVSTEEQTLNFSAQFQIEHIQKYCSENNIILKEIYDEGFGSGGSV